MSDQVKVSDFENTYHESILSMSNKDLKVLSMRASPKMGIRYAVKKRDTPVQIFTNLAAAVKKYNE